MTTTNTRERVIEMMAQGDPFGVASQLAGELDALKAEVATLTLKLANARLNLKHCSEEVDKRDECAGQLAEARAEIERLRLKAHAWDTQRHAMFLTAEQDADLLKYEWEVEDAFIVAFEAEAAERGIPPTEVSGYTDMKAEQAERIADGIYIDGDPAKGVAK